MAESFMELSVQKAYIGAVLRIHTNQREGVMKGTQVRSTPVGVWLASGYIMVIIMVMLGGITRLTQSGLSIVEWNVIMGTLPPLTASDWNAAFDKYKEFPEYKILNTQMTLDEFRSIFWWEYVHRLWGRLLGLVFVVPFAIFLIRRQLPGPIMRWSLVAFALGGLQGAIGWYMVKSGLADVPHVSHMRLTLHLALALAISGVLLWVALKVWMPRVPVAGSRAVSWIRIVLALVALQILLGGMVAGLHAGYMYNTYPLMGDDFLPQSAWMLPGFLSNFYENGVMVQFIHRWMAVVVLIAVLATWVRGRRYPLTRWQARTLTAAVVLVLVQFVLGVLTILYSVPVVLGVAHQANAFLLFGALLMALYHFQYPEVGT